MHLREVQHVSPDMLGTWLGMAVITAIIIIAFLLVLNYRSKRRRLSRRGTLAKRIIPRVAKQNSRGKRSRK
jgi:hypothetical protein